MNINEEALKIYEELPHGAKSLTAEKYGCANFYIRELLSKVTTPKETMIELMEKMIESSEEIEKQTSERIKNMRVIFEEIMTTV